MSCRESMICNPAKCPAKRIRPQFETIEWWRGVYFPKNCATNTPHVPHRFYRHRRTKVRDNLAVRATGSASTNRLRSGQRGLLLRRHDHAANGGQGAALL